MEEKHYNITRLANTVGIAMISQFLADIIFSLVDDNILKTDVIVSEVSIYFGTTATAIVIFALPENVDRLETIVISIVTYNYFTALAQNDFDLDFEIDAKEIVFTIILVELFTITFDKKSLNDYINKYNQRHHIVAPLRKTDKNSFEFLFIIFISNLIAYPLRRI